MFKAEYTKNKLHDLGMKQTWMADKLGISSQHLSNIVNGTKKPSMKLVEDMAKIMGVDYRTLWTEYDDVQVTCYEPAFDADEFREKMAEHPITVVPIITTEVYLDKDEARVLREWFERGHLFEIIRNDPSVADMDWLSCMMTIYAKCKVVE